MIRRVHVPILSRRTPREIVPVRFTWSEPLQALVLRTLSRRPRLMRRA